MKNQPMVSVICAVYNHEKTLEKCLDGIFMQKIAFDFEVIVRDDASTDGSYEILHRYQKQFPHQMSIIREEKNRFKEGVRAQPVLLQKAQGKYIAVCEGDDYWIDEGKLQTQVDYLEAHPETSLVFTDRKVIGNDGFGLTHWPRERYYTADVLTGFVAFTQTIMFRNISGLGEFINVHKADFFGDKLTSYYLSLFGTLDRIPRVTAVYRQDGGGIWSALSDVDRKKKVIKIYRNLTNRFSVDCKTCRLKEKYRLQNLVLGAGSLSEKWELLKWVKEKNMLNELGLISLPVNALRRSLSIRKRLGSLLNKLR